MALFANFQDQWTPVELSRRLRRKPLATRVAGEKVVFFRDRRGVAHALLDRCPHRGVQLSLGRVGEDGTLECPFHGWRFDGEGACTGVPMNDCSPDKRERLSATALPCREIGGLLWIYTATGEAPNEPVVPEALRDPAFVHYRYREEWKTHWTRAMENMLDFPHLPFVHRRTIGRQLRKQLGERSRMEVSYRPTATGALIGATLDGQPSGASVEWIRPNGMVLHIEGIPGKRVRQQIFCVPVDDRTTRMILVGSRDFGRFNPLAWIFDRLSLFILVEDRAVVESSSPAEVPDPALEKSVATDRPTLAFRRWYRDHLAGRGGSLTLLRRSAP